MKKTTIDCRGFVTRLDLHKAFAEALSFPDWYGNNLDALYDQLTSVCEDTAIVLQHWTETEVTVGRYAICARQAMEDAQQNNPKLKIVFE